MGEIFNTPLVYFKLEWPLPGWASIADFLIADIEEKEKNRVGKGGKNSPILPGP